MIYNKKKKKKSLKPRIQQGNSDVGLNFSVPSRLWDPLLPTGQQHHNILEYIYTVHILIHVHVSLLQRPCKCKKQQWIFNWPPINRNCFFLIPFFCHLYHSVYSVSQQLEPITLHEFFFFFFAACSSSKNSWVSFLLAQRETPYCIWHAFILMYHLSMSHVMFM